MRIMFSTRLYIFYPILLYFLVMCRRIGSLRPVSYRIFWRWYRISVCKIWKWISNEWQAGVFRFLSLELISTTESSGQDFCQICWRFYYLHNTYITPTSGFSYLYEQRYITWMNWIDILDIFSAKKYINEDSNIKEIPKCGRGALCHG